MARILVIDDDMAVRLTIKVILEADGHEVVSVEDGEIGLRALANQRPQLVITDIIMPNQEGIETIMLMRKEDATIPIIAISGGGRMGNADFLKMALKIGANEVLPKPFERRDLTTMVQRLLARGSMAENARGPGPATQ
jgi:two-component system chemotaxis response regulator CheY